MIPQIGSPSDALKLRSFGSLAFWHSQLASLTNHEKPSFRPVSPAALGPRDILPGISGFNSPNPVKELNDMLSCSSHSAISHN